MADVLSSPAFWAQQVNTATQQADDLRHAIERALAAYDAGRPADCREILEAALSADDDAMGALPITLPSERS